MHEITLTSRASGRVLELHVQKVRDTYLRSQMTRAVRDVVPAASDIAILYIAVTNRASFWNKDRGIRCVGPLPYLASQTDFEERTDFSQVVAYTD